MFVYQISMYWLNQMYIQKMLNAKSSFPRSCRWSSLEYVLKRSLALPTTGPQG